MNPFTYVFQDFALLPWRSVAGNVALALEHHRMSAAEREARIAEVLALCGLADFAHAFPKQLSGAGCPAALNVVQDRLDPPSEPRG